MDAEIGTYPLHLQFFLFFCLILYLFGLAEKNTIFFADSHWQIDINMTSHFMQLEKVGRGLLREAFWGEGKCYVSLKREGQIRKDRSWKTQVNNKLTRTETLNEDGSLHIAKLEQ